MSENINVKIGLEIHVPEPFSLRKKNVHEKERRT